MQIIELDTARLRLRQWHDGDTAAFAALNADPRVMEFFPAPLTAAESDALLASSRASIAANGWGRWAVERRDTREFIGFVGLGIPVGSLPFMPCVEIAWRLAAAHWGQGFASEAAAAILHVAYERLQMDEIVSFTTVTNRRSRAVMARVGMQDSGVTFQHPAVAVGSPLRQHCLFLLTREQWLARRPADEAIAKSA